jgi:hypothetical protein
MWTFPEPSTAMSPAVVKERTVGPIDGSIVQTPPDFVAYFREPSV